MWALLGVGLGMGVWSGEWDLFVKNFGRGEFGSWARWCVG